MTRIESLVAMRLSTKQLRELICLLNKRNPRAGLDFLIKCYEEDPVANQSILLEIWQINDQRATPWLWQEFKRRRSENLRTWILNSIANLESYQPTEESMEKMYRLVADERRPESIRLRAAQYFENRRDEGVNHPYLPKVERLTRQLAERYKSSAQSRQWEYLMEGLEEWKLNNQ